MSHVAREIDLLSGAWKREYFEDALAKAVSEAQKLRRPLSLIHFDVDDLQEQNDRYGREALDASLAWLALVVSKVVDGRGPIGRVGGDSFAIYLPNCPLEKARRLAEQIHKLIPQTLHASPTGDYRLTVCAGVAQLRKSEPWGNFFQAVEEACLHAKQSGRDAIVIR